MAVFLTNLRKECGMVTKIGLDLGYANITLSDATATIYREPSVALIDKDTRRIVGVGSSVLSGEDPATVDGMLVRPFKNGLLFDHKITQAVINNALRAIMPADKVRCVVGMPSDFIPKQERVIFDMLNEAGVTECLSVNRAVAALIGAGYSPLMSVISVNVGASTTEIAVLYNGEVTQSVKADVGGEDFDKAVQHYISEQGEVNVSLSVARAIKERLGSVWQGKVEECVDIEGIFSLTGNKVKMTVSSNDIVGVFEQPLHKLLRAIADVVKKIPLDSIEDTFKNGIILTGGGAMIYGLDMMMSKVLGIAVTRPANAIDCVAKGLARINNIVPLDGKTVNKNITSQIAKYYEKKSGH